jgi:hypothetical protein
VTSSLQIANKRVEIDEDLAPLGYDELCVVGQLIKKLSQGRITYGELKLDKEGRGWFTEMEEELFDLINYAGMN